MKQSTWFMGGVLGLTLAALVSRSTAVPVSDYPVQPVPFTRVHLHDDFWAPRIETNRLFTIPFAFEQCEKSGRMDNFERAAKILRGEPLANRQPPGYPFDDTDPYKVLEGASYVLAVQPDAKLKAYLDALIAKIAAAQEPDGYLYTARTIDPEHPHAWSGQQRWLRDPDQSHELYDSGHLFEAAVAHYQATGETNLLTVATRNADLLCRTFGTGSNQLNHLWPGHEIVEMGLAKLYRATGKEEYLQLAKFFIDTRGPGGDEYHQSHIKPVDQRAAVGHAVRASYLYSGMADVAAMTGDTAYTAAIDAIWENVAYKKLYITGGIGARGEGEAFGPDYFLPNMSAYSETCAAVGNDYWNARLFLFHGDARYMDVFERTLYNGLLAGVSLDGKGFFYPNPLESIGQHSRSPWFGCACCPGNITRFLPSLPGYFYAHQADQLYVNLYASSSAEIPLSADQIIALEQTTRYPWAGAIRLTVTPKTGSPEFALKLRIPDWARNEASPGDLYHFTDTNTEPVTLKINGSDQALVLDKGYATLRRIWKGGDVVELYLPMPVRRVQANPAVKADLDRVALQRGPIVYCLEWPDNDGRVRNLILPPATALEADFQPQLLNGVTTITGTGYNLIADDQKQITHAPAKFTAIPYYTWANRGRGEMEVWIPTSDQAGHVRRPPTLSSSSKITLSHPGNDLGAINDQLAPNNDSSKNNGFFGGQDEPFFHWWPRKGTAEWVQYEFSKPAKVSSAAVYWFDDTGRGECRVPANWQVLYRVAGQWQPVSTTNSYGVKPNQFNHINFAPVQTDALRLQVQLQEKWSTGIYEWQVE